MQICICCHVCVPEGCETFCLGVFCRLSIDSFRCGLIECTLHKVLCSARMHIAHHLRLVGNVTSYTEVKTLLPG